MFLMGWTVFAEVFLLFSIKSILVLIKKECCLDQEYVKAISSSGMQSNHGFEGQVNACWTHKMTSKDLDIIRSAGFLVSVIHGRSLPLLSFTIEIVTWFYLWDWIFDSHNGSAFWQVWYHCSTVSCTKAGWDIAASCKNGRTPRRTFSEPWKARWGMYQQSLRQKIPVFFNTLWTFSCPRGLECSYFHFFLFNIT